MATSGLSYDNRSSPSGFALGIGMVINDNSSVLRINITYNWASKASPTLGCSIEISRDIYVVGMSRMSN